jgi:hypothetical protein
MESSDPKYVGLLLDIAHSVTGGGHPAKAIHLKDVVDSSMDVKGAKWPFT